MSGRQKAWAANRAKAANNTNNNRAAMLIAEYKKQGMALQAIADLLNANNFRTATGKQFHKTTVTRIYERYVKRQELNLYL